MRFEHGDGGVGIDAPVDMDRECFAGVLVDNVAQLDDPPVGGDVELKVDAPHVIDMLGCAPVGRDGRVAQPPAFPPLLRDAEAFLAPQSLDLLAVVPPAGLDGCVVRPPVAPARPLPGEVT